MSNIRHWLDRTALTVGHNGVPFVNLAINTTADGSLSQGHNGVPFFAVDPTITVESEDPFTQADGPLSVNWEDFFNGITVGSNAALGGSLDVAARWVGTLFPPDQYAEAEIVSFSSGTSYPGVAVRLGVTGNGYGVAVDSSNAYLYRLTGGAEVAIATIATAWTAGDRIGLKAVGTTLQVFKDGVQIGTDQTDATYADGQPGLAMYGPASVDNWFAEGVVSVPVTISCNVGALALAGQAANVSVDQAISCNVGALALAGQAANVSVGQTISCNVGVLTLAGQSSLVGIAQTISCNVGVLALTGQATNVSVDQTISCNVGALALDGQAANVILAQNIACIPAEMSLAGLAATVSAETVIQQGIGELALLGLPALISVPQTISCNVGELSAQGLPAIVASPITISCGVAELAVTGLTGFIIVPQTIACGIGELSAAGLSSSVAVEQRIECAPGELGFLGLVAGIESSTGTPINCSIGSLVLTGRRALVYKGVLEARRIWVVPAEDPTWAIESEDPTWRLPAENSVYVVPQH